MKSIAGLDNRMDIFFYLYLGRQISLSLSFGPRATRRTSRHIFVHFFDIEHGIRFDQFLLVKWSGGHGLPTSPPSPSPSRRFHNFSLNEIPSVFLSLITCFNGFLCFSDDRIRIPGFRRFSSEDVDRNWFRSSAPSCVRGLVSDMWKFRRACQWKSERTWSSRIVIHSNRLVFLSGGPIGRVSLQAAPTGEILLQK